MTSRRQLHDRVGGFTVLEMAISLAIAGIALTVLLQLLSTALIESGRAVQVSEATMLGRSRLTEATALEPVKLGTTTGTGPHGLVWRVKLSPARNGAHIAGSGRSLVEVTVSVFALRRGAVTEVLQLNSLAFAAIK
jgi:Tfp pilus assembly protein PilE